MTKNKCIQNQPKPKKDFSFSFANEKTAICFSIMKNEDNVSLPAFCRIWDRKWHEDFKIQNKSKGFVQYAEVDKYGNVTQKYLGNYLLNLYNAGQSKFRDLTVEEVLENRQRYRAMRTEENIQILSKLAQDKGLSVFTSNNPNELSGFRIELIEVKNRCLQGVTFDLSFDDAKDYLLSVPPLADIKKQENVIVEALKGTNKSQQMQLVKAYKAPYTTHSFDVNINNILFRKKPPLDFDVIMRVTDMCVRNHIKNTSNNKPIILLKKESYNPNLRKKHNHKINKCKQKAKAAQN